ncbi:hypothetical protein [Chryseobacterium gallinarum]|uniref:Uncharacterized protein n=1 Tax=Chryseobacterium gallinarum TaxID=1324352 RepID=A0ABX6KUX3_CHRGL|nr:hypothetical protein [Chryseobacterium gallinarum]QIY91209.1 hypothetical protein FOB44_11385 [Chryseobacterium gallinarum]
MKQSGILFLIILFNYCFSQEKHETISIKEEYTPLKTYENDKIVKNDRKKEVLSYVYKISAGKDTVKYYNDTYTPIDKTIPITFILKNDKKNDNLILLINEEEKDSDSMIIKFTDQFQMISINQNDNYQLNPIYYSELKNSIYINKNILDLTDLLDDNLGDYPYQLRYLNRISSYKKYKNQDFKIIKATVKTSRTQSDEQDTWNVIYKYDKSNILQSVAKTSTDGEISFEKKLLSKKNTEYKFKVHNNVESRYEDNDEITFDVNKNTYSRMQSHFQFGLVKEETSQLKTILFRKE